MSAFYDKGRESFLGAAAGAPVGQQQINWATDTIKAALVNVSGTGTTYTFNAAHQFFSDIAAGAIIGTPVTLANKTITGGVADADDFTFTAVSGASVEAIVYYKDTGVSTTSQLICYVDGISVTPNGGNITINLDNGVNKIFKL